MAAADFIISLPHILVYEGGKSDNPKDPGGRTNQGITQATFNAWLRSQGQPLRDVYTITPVEVGTIYRTQYWDRGQCDAMPAGFDFCFFDASVNSGVGRATLWLQQSMDAYAGQNDGDMGPKTLQALADVTDVDKLIVSFCAHRLGTLERLNTWKTFGTGWHARIANVQRVAEAMYDGAVKLPGPVDVTSAGGHQKAPVDENLIKPPVPAIVAHATAAATTIGTVASSTAQQVQPLSDTFGWVKYVFGGLTLLAIVVGILVKFSQDATAQAIVGTATKTVNPDADAAFPTVPVAATISSPAPAGLAIKQ